VGHSWGASVALHFAAHHPDEVRALALVDGGVIDISELSSWEEAEKRMMPPAIDGVPVDRFVGFASKWPHFRDIWSPQIEEMVLSNLLVEEGKVYRRLPIEKHMMIAKTIYELKPAGLYPKIRCPVLLVPAMQAPSNEQERMWHTYRQRGVEAALQLLANARVKPIENSPHDIPVFRPDELAQAIIEFAEAL
jgi:pimeloyl-ACP methyl ester carboxylesterase